MKNSKTYIIILFIITSTISFAQKITINRVDNNNAITYLIIKDVKIALKQQKITKKSTNNNYIKYTIDSDTPNVICNINSNLKFIIKNQENLDLNIEILKLDKTNSLIQHKNKSNLSLDKVKFTKKKKKENYAITIPEIEKGTYAILINSMTCNLFEVN